MALNFAQVRRDLDTFDFRTLFVETLGWNAPPSKRSETLEAEGITFTLKQVAELAGVMVLEATTSGDTLPDAKTRRALHKQVGERYLENLLIFVDEARTRSLWEYAKREGGKTVYRPHTFVKGQPGDLFIGKLSGIIFDVKDFDEGGNVSVVEVAARLKNALDVERTTKKFYAEFEQQHLAFVELIDGIPDDRARRWYASVLLNRLMFVYFLQRKGFVDGGKLNYLQDKLSDMQQGGKNYYTDFLRPLFFEGFAKPAEHRTPEARALLGEIKYLNGGLFLKHTLEQHHPNISIPNEAFSNLLSLFSRYSWNLNDLPGEADDEINPDVLGYIFEKYINQKAFGAYYTRPEITEYLCEQTINRLILEAVNVLQVVPGSPKRKHFGSVADLLMNLDAQLCKQLLDDVLPKLNLLDPACGSGAFLVAALNTLRSVYEIVLTRTLVLRDDYLREKFEKIQREHPSLTYYIKKRIITDNLYGVDLMEEATDIAKLRLFLALVASADKVTQLEPLPNIDFNIMPGNSLVGLTRVDPNEFDKQDSKGNVQTAIFGSPYERLVSDVNRQLEVYKQTDRYAENLTQAREDIRTLKRKANTTLDDLLLDKFRAQKIQFEAATWDDAKNKAGKPQKRPLSVTDVQELKPFHWGFEFHKVLSERGGFDAIITNPPWDILKPNAKEFFQEHSELISKKKMDIKAFEKAQAKLLRDAEVKRAWLEYLSGFPHQSAYFRTSPGYANQISVVNGKKAGSDINLYKLFTEQCFNLLRDGGQCGIVIPSGIYTDLGAKQLREMLFAETQVTGLFGFENRKTIFEGVHRSFKFVVLSFTKGGHTEQFPAAFMRLETRDLELFPEQLGLEVSVDLIKRLSPDSLSVMEFKNEQEVVVIDKISQHPVLSNEESDFQHVRFMRELAPDSKSTSFDTSASKQKFPVLEGRNVHQFTHQFSLDFRYWVSEQDARSMFVGKKNDYGQILNYQTHRLGFRKIARNTDQRTMIATVIPPALCSENFQTVKVVDDEGRRVISRRVMFYLAAVLNSFVFDFILRSKVTANINFFFVYSSQIPNLSPRDSAFSPIVERAAKLICTTGEFDDLAAEVGLGSHQNGVTDPEERAALRAELDGLVAHLYGLSESEFAYILTTFPLVDEAVKTAALTAFNHFAPTSDDTDILELIAAGESAGLEFKATARVNLFTGAADKKMEEVILKTVAGFWNAAGGTLLVGVSDDGTVLGLDADMQTLKKRDLDGLELFLTDLLLSQRLGLSGLVQVTFHEVQGKTVCKLAVEAAPEPVWVTVGGVERLFVRTGNATHPLAGGEAYSYARRRWR